MRKAFCWALGLGIVAMVGCGKPEPPPAVEPVTPPPAEEVVEVEVTDTMAMTDTMAEEAETTPAPTGK